MTTQDKIIKNKLGLLKLAQQLSVYYIIDRVHSH